MSATHGKAGTYRSTVYACRCDECCRANTERFRQERSARAARLAADPSLVPHGRVSTYTNWLCRCVECVAAHSTNLAERRAQRRGDQP